MVVMKSLSLSISLYLSLSLSLSLGGGYVAERLGHLAAVSVADHGVEEDVGEGNLAAELHTHHDHARDPEEEDVPAGLEERVGVERLRESGGIHT